MQAKEHSQCAILYCYGMIAHKAFICEKDKSVKLAII